ncbi:RNA polymerase I-specific transcription initiation factor RRN3 [Bagarius yarrelli]|uniref:RNA polymerase I-specific transcription initiation factor RRN3 n=1 Tax=Bagarius yarrelli TaxID=175774 RepID=A0A556UZI6_BAGYA|nr:RNA polymerase I-specific transcription initiation factor RRN3 [Bagarius yarrelli]
MEVERDFICTPPPKTVRFGDSVANSLVKLKQGDPSDYEMIKHQLSDPEIKDAQIISWLQEFRSCVTQLGKEHEQLIYTVLRLPWPGRSPAVVDEYLAFLSNLISAQTVYLRSCLKTLVSNFTPRRVKIQEGNVDISDSDDDDENLPRIFDRCHQALQMIARYVPSRDVLELIISKMLTLDVSAPRSEIEEVESMGGQNRGAGTDDDFLFDMDEDDGYSQDDGLLMRHSVAERLDTLMLVLLAFIKDMSHVNGVLDVERVKTLYRDLVYVFDKLVLPTHACAHVQFCVFYLCSFRLGLAEAFLDHLWKVLQSLSQPAVLRQAAASYIGSFLARAKFVPVAKYQVVFCYTIIERNNRTMLPVVRTSVGGDSVATNTNPLDTFFPFDPYLLKRSGQYIDSLYQVWEEPSDCMGPQKKKGTMNPTEEEDDFLHGETPKADTVMGSYESHLRSPSSVGSPPIAFLQRPF